jgi:hypothetical protein
MGLPQKVQRALKRAARRLFGSRGTLAQVGELSHHNFGLFHINDTVLDEYPDQTDYFMEQWLKEAQAQLDKIHREETPDD